MFPKLEKLIPVLLLITVFMVVFSAPVFVVAEQQAPCNPDDPASPKCIIVACSGGGVGTGWIPCGNMCYEKGSTKTITSNGKSYTVDISGLVGNQCGFNDVITIVKNIVNWLIYAGMILSALAFIYVGWLYLSAGGNESKVKQAKEIVWKVVLGFIIMASAWLIVQTIEKTFVASSSGIPSLLDPQK